MNINEFDKLWEAYERSSDRNNLNDILSDNFDSILLQITNWIAERKSNILSTQNILSIILSVIRLLVCPVKKRFMIDPMNLVDLLTLVPFYLAVLLKELEDLEIVGKAGKILRLLKVKC